MENHPPTPRRVFMSGLRIIGSYIATHPLPFTLAVTGAAVYAATTVASTFVLGWLTDHVLVPAFSGQARGSTIAAGAMALMAVALVRSGGIVTRRYFAGMTVFRMQATLRARIVDRYQKLPLSYHRSHPTGELLAHAESDVEAACVVINPLPFSTAVVLLVVFATVALLVTDPFLALFGCSILPALGLLNRFYSSRVEPAASRAQARVGDVSSVVHESIDGALVVKTLGREEAEVGRLAAAVEALRDQRVQVGRLRAAFEPGFSALPDLGIVVLLGVGSWRVSTGAITIGTLVRFVSLFQLLAFPMRLIGFLLADIPRAVVGRGRIEEVLREPLPAPPAAEALPRPDGALGLSVRSVSFSYGESRVLDGVSFEVAPNEAVALVGATGSGKSTVAHLLAGLEHPDLGSVRLGGIDIRHLQAGELRAATAVVFQESFLFGTTVRDNITLGLEIPDSELRRASRLAQADQFVAALPRGYDTEVGERGVTLSGGQRQRIALARALVRRPRLLILDDAMSAVDATVEAAILEGLRRELRTGLVVVAYRVSTMALADRVLFLEDGRIVAEGSHEELLSHPAYEAMVRAYERGGA